MVAIDGDRRRMNEALHMMARRAVKHIQRPNYVHAVNQCRIVTCEHRPRNAAAMNHCRNLLVFEQCLDHRAIGQVGNHPAIGVRTARPDSFRV